MYIYIYTQEVQRPNFAHWQDWESFTWIILKTILCLVLDPQGIYIYIFIDIYLSIPSLKLTVCPWKIPIEILVNTIFSWWRSIFMGTLLVSGRVYHLHLPRGHPSLHPGCIQIHRRLWRGWSQASASGGRFVSCIFLCLHWGKTWQSITTPKWF